MSEQKIDFPAGRGLFYEGKWRQPIEGKTVDVSDLATGEVICTIGEATAADVSPAVAAT